MLDVGQYLEYCSGSDTHSLPMSLQVARYCKPECSVP